MTKLVPSRPSFSTGVEFMEWIQAHADDRLSQILAEESSEFLIELQGLLEKNGDVRGDYGMLKLSGTLGQSIPQFMSLAQKAKSFASTPDKRAFVISSAITLFRLIDRGISGIDHNISQGADKDMPPLFDDNMSMEDMFVRPLAEQAFAQSSELLQDLGAS